MSMMNACRLVMCASLPLVASCAAKPMDAPLHDVPDQRVGVYSNGRNVIVIDLDRSAMSIDGESVALYSCSDDSYHCYKNESLGFHIVFPKNCFLPWDS